LELPEVCWQKKARQEQKISHGAQGAAQEIGRTLTAREAAVLLGRLT
jgi:hypothetical protein